MRRLRSQEGFTVVEAVVAAFCLALILAGLAALFAAGSHNSLASQRQAALVSVADQQIERIRQAVKTSGFSALAMTAMPASATNSTLPYSPTTHTDPNDLVVSSSGCGSSAAGYTIELNYDDTSEGTVASAPPGSTCPAGTEPLIVSGTGIVTPSRTVSSGSGTATVNTYVTETYVGCNTSLGSGSCAQDARRVIVAVRLNGPTRRTVGPNSPLYVSTIFTNPIPTNQPNSAVGITLGLGIG